MQWAPLAPSLQIGCEMRIFVSTTMQEHNALLLIGKRFKSHNYIKRFFSFGCQTLNSVIKPGAQFPDYYQI
jgi:hypothetical protein